MSAICYTLRPFGRFRRLWPLPAAEEAEAAGCERPEQPRPLTTLLV